MKIKLTKSFNKLDKLLKGPVYIGFFGHEHYIIRNGRVYNNLGYYAIIITTRLRFDGASEDHLWSTDSTLRKSDKKKLLYDPSIVLRSIHCYGHVYPYTNSKPIPLTEMFVNQRINSILLNHKNKFKCMYYDLVVCWVKSDIIINVTTNSHQTHESITYIRTDGLPYLYDVSDEDEDYIYELDDCNIDDDEWDVRYCDNDIMHGYPISLKSIKKIAKKHWLI